MGPQALPVQPDQWMPYEGEAAFLLGQNYKVLVTGQGQAASGKLLDLSMFTEPPQNYYVFKGREVVVANPRAEKDLKLPLGTRTVAGYPVEIWETLAKNSKMLPPALSFGIATGCFYQVHHDSLSDLEKLEKYLEDTSRRLRPPEQNPRRRIVVFLQFPSAMAADTRRFARRKAPSAAAAVEDGSSPTKSKVTVLEEDSKVPAVYEWWFGPAPFQADVKNPPEGRWKRYHPQVCRRLEELLNTNGRFREGDDPVDLDGVRYMMQRITPDKPFDYHGKESREPVQVACKITVDHRCYSEMDRVSNNCFVQFQKGNPYRRRPARRRPDASEIAGAKIRTGDPCMICLTEDGQLTGCNTGHVICKSCLRRSLRAIAGDILMVENLLCGCFGKSTRKALLALATLADTSFQEAQLNVAEGASFLDELDKEDIRNEEIETRSRFDIPANERIPDTVYQQKIKDWFSKVFINDIGHLYYPCAHPECSSKMENWILKTDFEEQYQARGQTVWKCPLGHRNCVLPSEDEVKDVNKNLLLHPEYYILDAFHDHCSLRRYRLCPECIQGGIIMLAVHSEGCKQWPGGGRGHQHCFCFACTRPWGRGCNHGSTDCRDPGIQQVRVRSDDQIELGYVDGGEYLRWLNREIPEAPPTRWACGEQELGSVRQQRLGLVNQAELLAESRKGTM